MFKNLLLTTCLAAILGACSAEVGSETVPPATEEKAGAGPYTVDFNNSAKTYEHKFSIPIAQDEGKVEYYISSSDSADIELVGAVLKVTGCPASQVVHNMFWLPDSHKTEGIYVKTGETFKTRANLKGTFLHVIRGLTGCQSVELSTTLRQKPKAVLPPRTCKESSESTCKVEMYCSDPDFGNKYLEVEVWKESWGTTLRKYSVSSNGTRSISAMDTVTASTNGNQVTYHATRSSNSLSVNTATGKSVYTLNMGGHTFQDELTCQSYL